MVSASEELLAGPKCGSMSGEPSSAPAGECVPWTPVPIIIIIITGVNGEW